MADLVMIATMVGFVLLCIAYVHWCDRVIAADQADTRGDEASSDAADRGTDADRAQVAA
jgi:hypothetical protein